MAVTIVATPAAANANSYCTSAEADTYHEGHLYSSTWDAATADEKNRALVMATKLLDEYWEWVSWPTEETQALQWPRTGVMDHLRLSEIDSMTIPPKLKEATAELARHCLASDITAENDVVEGGISSFSAGPVSFSFRPDFDGGTTIPDRITTMLPRWWGQMRGGGGWKPIVRS